MFGKSNAKIVDVNDIDELIGNIDLIDIREPYEYQGGSIKTAKNIPMETLIEDSERYLEKDKQYYILCRSGARSARTCSELRKKGYDVIDVAGGVMSYRGENRI